MSVLRRSDVAAFRALAGLMAITAVGLLLRTWQIGNESAWWDEVASLKWLSAPTFSEFLHRERVADPAMPPCYFALEYAWSRLVGTSVMMMRLLSVFFGVLALQVMFLVARLLYGTRAGLVASLALAISMVHIYYSQEIRVYALVPVLALLSVYTLLMSVTRRRPQWWAFHFGVNAALAFTHVFAVLLFAAEGCYLLLFRRRQARAVTSWILAHVVIAALLVVWLTTLDTSNVSGVTSWIVKPGVRELGMLWLVFAGGRASNENPASHLPTGVSLDGVLAAIMALVIAVFVVRHFREGGNPGSGEEEPLQETRDCNPLSISRNEALGLLMLWAALPPLVLCVASYGWRPCFVYRYVLYSSLSIYILLAGALTAMRSGRVKLVVVCGLLGIMAHQLSALAVGPFRPDWQSVSHYLESRAAADDCILVFQDINLAALEYNSVLPRSQMQHVPVWSEVCPRVLEAHGQGRDVWFIVWLWSDPAKMEACFTSNNLAFAITDFKGWPNLRVYHLPARSNA